MILAIIIVEDQAERIGTREVVRECTAPSMRTRDEIMKALRHQRDRSQIRRSEMRKRMRQDLYTRDSQYIIIHYPAHYLHIPFGKS